MANINYWQYGWDIYISEGSLYFGTGNGAASWATISAPISTNRWYHAVGVRDSSGILHLYLNGVAVGTPVNAGLGYLSSVGEFGDGYLYTTWLNALIDDVRVYNRALTATQIAAMYNGGK
jgi:hypothetical protein